ncbi:MAG: hypothetical protein ACTSWY_13075 [Promethearchaeota archaeon]
MNETNLKKVEDTDVESSQMQNLHNKKIAQKERVIENKNYPITLKIAGAGIFAALSLVLNIFSAPLVDVLRIPGWYISWFDPVSVIWISSFFIFGYETGILTAIIGSILLNITPEVTGYIGPLMKFTATIPLIIVPWVIMKIQKKKSNSEYILNRKNLMINGVISAVVRIIVMVFLNILAIEILMPAMNLPFTVSITDYDLGWMNLSVVGLMAIIVTVGIINAIQTVWDYLISYLLVKAIFSGSRSLPW